MPVLITCGLSPEAYRLQRILNTEDIVFADKTSLPLFSSKPSFVLPACTSSSFVHEMLKSCLDHKITHVYPLNKGEILELSKARDLFLEYDIILMIPTDNWLKDWNEQIVVKGENITVLENGRVLAGSDFMVDVLKEETGVFTWATRDHNLEYSLYLV